MAGWTGLEREKKTRTKRLAISGQTQGARASFVATRGAEPSDADVADAIFAAVRGRLRTAP
jgi:hypothetical protein